MAPLSVTVDEKNEAHLPAEALRELHAEPGNELDVYINGANLVIFKRTNSFQSEDPVVKYKEWLASLAHVHPRPVQELRGILKPFPGETSLDIRDRSDEDE